MATLTDSAAKIQELEARQDEALRQLEELEQRIAEVLAEYAPLIAPKTPPAAAA